MSYKNGLSNKEISEALRLLSDTDLVKNYLVKKSISLAADRIDFNDSLIAELEQQLAKNGEVNRWTPVTESLPSEKGLYLIIFYDGVNSWFECFELCFTHSLVFNNLIKHGATHWMKTQEVK